MIYAKKQIEELFRTAPGLKNRINYLRLDMNESVTGLPPWFVKKCLSQINNKSLSMYPEYAGLLDALARHNGLNPYHICISNGSDAAIKYIFDAYVEPNDRVLITNPTFAMYPVYCRMFQARSDIIEYNHDLSFPVGRFLNKLSAGMKMAVIVNPNNPCGSAVSKKDLIKILKKAARHNILLVIDEAYYYFYPYSMIRLVKKFDNLIVLRTFSKLFSIASLRIGYAAACRQIIENIRKARLTFDVNGPAALFARNLLNDSHLIKKMVNSMVDGKRYLIRQCREAGIEYRDSHANFILLKCHGKVKRFMAGLFKKGILVSGQFEQEFLKDYIRVTIGDVKVMKKFWKEFIKLNK